jgi:arylsulfatase A-like enzyme
MDENARYKEDSDLVRQTKGSFHIVYSYMDEMKKLGLYENATIIITGDHGKSQDITPLDYASCIGFFVKPKGKADTALVQSNAPVSHENLLPTILKSEGLDYTPYGVSAFDVPQDSDLVRHFYYRWDLPTGQHVLEHFEIRGNARDFENWLKIEEIPIQYLP